MFVLHRWLQLAGRPGSLAEGSLVNRRGCCSRAPINEHTGQTELDTDELRRTPGRAAGIRGAVEGVKPATTEAADRRNCNA